MYKFTSKKAVIEAACSFIEERAKRYATLTLTSPQAVKRYLMLQLQDLEHEVFLAVFLDNQNRLIATEKLASGTIDGASVYPREVVKTTLAHNAAAVIFAHNHPSGVAEPSRADHNITKRLKDALALIEVRVLDHIIVGSECLSFSEMGYL